MSNKSLVQLRPKPKRDLDQFGVTGETLKDRAELMEERGLLTDVKLLFMGDYDLTSLAVLPLVKNCEIWVLDVDKEVVDVINKESRGAITAVEHNLLNPLPKRLINNFDAVFMDPPYTPWGVGLFLSRAVEVLYEKGMGKILLSYGSLDMVRVLAVQDEISKHGLVIEEIISKFNKYVNARTIGGFSDLYVLSVTAKTRPVIKGTYSGKVYTHE